MEKLGTKVVGFGPARLSIARQGSFRVNKDGFTFFDTNAKGAGFGGGSLDVVRVISQASDFISESRVDKHTALASRSTVQVQDPAQGHDELSEAEFFKKIDEKLASLAENERFTKNGINSKKIDENIENAGGIGEVKENLYNQYVEMCRDIFTKEAAERLQMKRLEMCAFGVTASIRKYCSNLTGYWPATFAASYLRYGDAYAYYDTDSLKFEVIDPSSTYSGDKKGWVGRAGKRILADLHKKGETIYKYNPGCLRYGRESVAFGYLRNIGKNTPEDSTYSILKKYMTEEEKEAFDDFLKGKGQGSMNSSEASLFTRQFFRSIQKDPCKYETVDDALYRESTKKAKETFEKSKDQGVCVKGSGFDGKKFDDVREAFVSSWAITQEVLSNVKLPDGYVKDGKVLLFRGDPEKHVKEGKLLRAIFDSTSLLTQSYEGSFALKNPIPTKQLVPFHRCIYNYMVSLEKGVIEINGKEYYTSLGVNQVCLDCEMEFGAILSGIEPERVTEEDRQAHITDAMFKAIDFNREHGSLKEFQPKNENVKKSS